MCDHVWIFEARTLSTQPVGDDAACAVYTGWNQGAENRASRPMAGQIRRNPPGLPPRVARLGSCSYLPGQPSQIGGSRIERGQSAGGYSDPSIDQIGV